MLLLCSLCTILIGWCLGGRLSRFERAGLRWTLLPAAALLCRYTLTFLPWVALAPVLLTGSYLLLFVFLWHNRHLALAALFLGLGSLCNYIVIAVNGFVMPVSERAFSTLSSEGAAALIAGEIPMYRAADSATRLLFLGDIFWFPVPFFHGFASVGDVLLCVGVFFLLMAVMGPSRLIRRGKREAAPAGRRRSS